tara:strand:+ start:77 stop:202 length:126 start_codon:yes stop_codon:yes gene_type:complete
LLHTPYFKPLRLHQLLQRILLLREVVVAAQAMQVAAVLGDI